MPSTVAVIPMSAGAALVVVVLFVQPMYASPAFVMPCWRACAVGWGVLLAWAEPVEARIRPRATAAPVKRADFTVSSRAMRGGQSARRWSYPHPARTNPCSSLFGDYLPASPPVTLDR